MYLIRFLANFKVFCFFWWISKDFTDLPEFHSTTTVRNIRGPEQYIDPCLGVIFKMSQFNRQKRNVPVVLLNDLFPYYFVLDLTFAVINLL